MITKNSLYELSHELLSNARLRKLKKIRKTVELSESIV